MAYEAMNNAGALRSRLIVVLTTTTCRSPAGRRHVGAPVATLVGPALCQPAQSRSHRRRGAAQAARAGGQARRGIRARPRAGGHAVRGSWASTISAPVDGHNLDHLLPVLKNARDSQLRQADPGPCRDQEGQGYPPAEASADKVPWRREVRTSFRQAVQAGGQRPAYQAVFAKR